jgi:hypothetical protein
MISTYNLVEDLAVLSGTLRSTLDVFDEYEDVEIVLFFFLSLFSTSRLSLDQFDALRRVHLLKKYSAEDGSGNPKENLFSNLDSPVSDGGGNFSVGYVIRIKAFIRNP